MTDLKSVEQAAQTDVAKVQSQWAFVRTNWTRVSLIVIATFVAGVAVGHFVL